MSDSSNKIKKTQAGPRLNERPVDPRPTICQRGYDDQVSPALSTRAERSLKIECGVALVAQTLMSVLLRRILIEERPRSRKNPLPRARFTLPHQSPLTNHHSPITTHKLS